MPNAFDDLPPLPAEKAQNAFDDLHPEVNQSSGGFMSFIPEAISDHPLLNPQKLLRGATVAGQALSQGLFLGAPDELLAGIGIGEGETFEERRQSHVRPLQELREKGEIPRAITSGIEGAGGFLSGFGLPGMAARAAAPVAAAAAPTVKSLLSKAGQFVKDTAAMATRGAAEGGTYGFASAEPGERIEGGGVGAAAGGTLGLALPATMAVVRGAGAAKNRVGQAFQPPAQASERMLMKDISDSGETVETLSKKAVDATKEGGPVQLVDLLPAFQTRAQSVYASGGPGGETVRKRLSDRAYATDNDPRGAERAYRRITKTLNNIIAGNTNWREAKDALRANVKKLAKPSYDEAYTKSIDVNEEMINILRTKDGKTALAYAEEIGENEAAGSGLKFDRAPLEEIAKIASGEPPGTVRLSVEGADLIKKSLDHVALKERNNAFNSGGLGGTTEVGRSVEGMRKRWLENIDGQLGGADPDLNPYFRARQQYQGLARANAAMNVGLRVNRYTHNELAEEMAEMSTADRLHLRLGLLSNLHALSSKSGARAQRLLADEGYKEKMHMILGDDYSRVRAFLEPERMGETSLKTVIGGSPTQPRRAAERRMEGEQQQMDDAILGTISGRPSSLLNWGLGSIKRAFGPSEETNSELARLLTTEGGSPILETLKRLGVNVPQAIPPTERDRLARALLRGGITGVGSAAQ